MSEQSDSLINDTKDLDVSQIDNFYEKKRQREEKLKLREERQESLMHKFKGSLLNQMFNDYASRS